MSKQLLYFVATATLAMSISACGSKGPLPTSELALAGSALESAELAGAREHAPIELRVAREKQANADKAVARENFVKARYLTIEARVDAELARATADAKKSQEQLQRARENIRSLRDDTIPTGNPQ